MKAALRSALAGGFVLLLIAAGFALYIGLDHLPGMPVSLVIDGVEVARDLDPGQLSAGHKLTLVAAVLLTVLIVVLVLSVVLPLALALVVLAIGLALLAGLGTPLLAVLVVLALLASPFLIIGALVWGLMRLARRDRTGGPSATIRG
jgi:hypothetical protein